MRKRTTLIAGAALVLILLVAGVIVGVRLVQGSNRTNLQQAMSLAPDQAQRFSWTDWSAVRKNLKADLDTDSSSGQVRDFLAKGYDADLTSTSALVESAPVLQVKFGFSPASADWELFSQGEEGAVVMLHLPESFDFGALTDRLVDLGYAPPSSDAGIWLGGDDVLARISLGGTSLTPELQFISLDAENGLVFTSDSGSYLRTAIDEAGDEAGDAGSPVGLEEVVDSSGTPLSASIFTSDYTCSGLAMSQADQSDQDQAAELIRAAGKINPVTGFAMSVQPNLHIRVAMSFENEDQARTNADSRATLAGGPAPGQGGEFSDRFNVGSVTADGPVVLLDLEPVERSYVISDLSSGPLLFASC